MPSVSKKQEKFFRAVAKDPKFANKAHISQKVAEEFFMADEAKKKPKESQKSKQKKRYGDK